VYPLKARLEGEGLTYGETLEVPIAGKDCVVIEVGLDAPEHPEPYAQYEQAVERVRRSFDTLCLTPPQKLVDAVRSGPVRMVVGDGARDRRIANQLVDALGATIGRRIDPDEWMSTPADDARCRLFIGTHEGLSTHPAIGALFQETLYERYIAWDGQLISAPVVLDLESRDVPTYALVAPRPEQLARLAINATSEILADAWVSNAPSPKPVWEDLSLTSKVPAERSILRFRPLMKLQGALVMPNELSHVRYEIRASVDGADRLVWSEDIPPFETRAGDGGWWQDRVISIADFAGRDVTFRFIARHVDGREQDPRAVGGFDRIAVMQLKGPQT
jgi:hypothetical protein